MNNTVWDSEDWLERFHADNPNYRQLQIDVWKNTKTIVEAGGYILDGKHISVKKVFA